MVSGMKIMAFFYVLVCSVLCIWETKDRDEEAKSLLYITHAYTQRTYVYLALPT